MLALVNLILFFCVFLSHAAFQWEFFLQCRWSMWIDVSRFMLENIMLLEPLHVDMQGAQKCVSFTIKFAHVVVA